MKKVLYILEDGRFGGMNKMTADISSGLRNYNINSHILVGLESSEFFSKYLDTQKLQYSRIKLNILSKNKKLLFNYFLFFFRDLFSIIRFIKTYQPDLIYCNGSQQIKGVIAGFFFKKSQVVWHMHDTYQPKSLKFLYKFIRSFFCVKWHVASSEKTIEFYQLNKSKTLISRPPVNSLYFNTFLNKYNNWKSNIFNREIRILMIANFNQDKGIDTFVRTINIINSQLKNCEFIMAGLIPTSQTNLFQQIQALVSELEVTNLKFIGQVTDVRSLLNSSDVYLCTSRNESGPLSVFEALSMGVPVITTDVGDLSYLFDLYNYGKVCPVDDYYALSSDFISTLSNKETYLHKSLTGKIIVEKELDIQICIRKQVEFYNRIFLHAKTLHYHRRLQ